jgi:hypothetical protein
LQLQGVMGSGVGFLAMSWCIGQRGPVFTTAFTPLIQLIAGAVNIVALHEQLHLGRYTPSARGRLCFDSANYVHLRWIIFLG